MIAAQPSLSNVCLSPKTLVAWSHCRETIRRLSIGLGFGIILIAPINAQTAAPSGNVDPATLDIAGVKLGMTPDQAANALKQFDPQFVIKKLYSQGAYSGYAIGGADLEQFSAAERAKFYFTGLSALDEGQIHDDVENITVGFSPVPGQERVIGITREKTFNNEPKPPIATLLTGLLAKYPYQPTFQHPISGGILVGWQFDARKQLVSGATAKSKRIGEVLGQMPRTVSPGDGISLSARVVQAVVGSVPNIAGSLYMSLVDADALYKSNDQSKQAAAAVGAKVDAATIEKARGASQTKF